MVNAILRHSPGAHRHDEPRKTVGPAPNEIYFQARAPRRNRCPRDTWPLELGASRGSVPGMTTLADIRSRLRTDLRDTDSNAYRWSDAALDRHIAHALEDLGLAIPRELSTTLATTAGSRELSTASLTGLIEVEAVEFPVEQFPPAYTGFSYWAGTLHLHLDAAPDGSDAKVWHLARHVLDGSGSTVPVHLEDVLLMGAAAYALLEISTYAIDRLNTGGPDVTDLYGAAGRARLTAFNQLLQQYGRKNRVNPRRMYTPA